MYDVIIIGGGPGGMSAALVLGRCRRRVLLFDDDRPRNARSSAVHGFLTRDGISPAELRRIAREELVRYSVELRAESIVDAARTVNGFTVTTAAGEQVASQKLLLATGMRDHVPDIPGLDPLLGKSVFQCPYCDGWEVRDQALASYASGQGAAQAALGLLTWSRDVVLFTDEMSVSPEDREVLARNGVVVRTEAVLGVRAEGGQLRAVRLAGGEEVPRDAIFLHLGQAQRSPLTKRLGCPLEENATVLPKHRQSTDVPGLYVAGDAAGDVEWAIVAAAEGARAAQAINQALRNEKLA